MADQNCAHSGCDCKVEEGKGLIRAGKNFCSDHCANAGASGSESCGCGHPDCR